MGDWKVKGPTDEGIQPEAFYFDWNISTFAYWKHIKFNASVYKQTRNGIFTALSATIHLHKYIHKKRSVTDNNLHIGFS